LRYGAKLGKIEGELSAGVTGELGVRQDVARTDASDYENDATAGARIGVGVKAKVWGVGIDEFLGTQFGDAREPLKTTPVEADGTVSVTFTIPTLWVGSVPVGGPQITFGVNLPAAFRALRDGIASFFGKGSGR
jgi:hypothetical protein